MEKKTEIVSKKAKIRFSIPRNPKKYQFQSFAGMVLWAEDMLKTASFLSDALEDHKQPISTVFCRVFVAAHKELATATLDARQFEMQLSEHDFASLSDEKIEAHLDEIRRRANDIFQGYVPTADSPVCNMMQNSVVEDRTRSLALGLLNTNHPNIDGQSANQFQWKLIKEAIHAETLGSDAKVLAKAFQDESADLFARSENFQNQLNSQHQELTSEAEKLIKNSQHNYERASKIFSTFFKKCNSERKKQSQELEALKKAYENHMALKAPAKYWKDKSIRHLWGFGVACMTFVFLISSALYVIWHFGPSFVFEVTDGKEGFSLAAFAMITLPALLLAWLLKVVANQIAANHHASQDSALRQTMITTYLALMSDPSTQVGIEERTLILNAIFRPADRHSDDNGPSAGLVELVRQAKSP